ncbi:MAG: LVIVD repeat-containing protein [Actinomycetota bacterium]
MAALATHRRAALVAVVAVVLLLAAQGSLEAKGQGRLRVLAHIPYGSGTDISFAGDRVFLTQSGAVTNGRVRIIDASSTKPKVLGDFACGGNQNDIAAISEDLIAVGSHWGSCGAQPSSGINLIDVSNPTNPQQLGFAILPVGTHTLTVHPSEPLIYASNSIVDPNFIIDITNTNAPLPIPTNLQACHDITFHITKTEQLAFCAGGPNTQIWDVSDPRAPTVISTIDDAGIGYHHQAMATPDGAYLLIGDEDSRGTCSNNQKTREFGAVSIYDIRDRENPKMVGFMNAPRGPSVCWAHNFNFIDDRTFVIGWWQAGTSVIDISNPAKPEEIDFFQPDTQAVWSSYFYKSRIWVNSGSGAWVLDAKGL